MPDDAARRSTFGALVSSALAEARRRGLTTAQIEASADMSKSTIYRWASGEWTREPAPAQVRKLFLGLGINPTPALRALGWDDPVADPPMDPDVRLILRTLADPNVPDSDKAAIREVLRLLAHRTRTRPGPTTSDTMRTDRRTG